MTKDHKVDHLSKDLPRNDNNHAQPFEIVLIDIKRAAKGEIHCIKKSLVDDDRFKYVAISYRQGEVDKTIIDTGVGYSACLTAFHLQDFYQLCATMTLEPDLKSIDYVWVNVICLNQSKDEQKATIHYMPQIYERATWILVVPDLHATYIMKNPCSNSIMDFIRQHQKYIYHLMMYGNNNNNNTNQLAAYDDIFCDSIGVPEDPCLRQWLTTTATTTTECDLIPTSKKASQEIAWQQQIYQRNSNIRLSMNFLADLLLDWASRIWVIREFHIAKKKNNLKFWFIPLCPPPPAQEKNGEYNTASLPFFKYDMHDPQSMRHAPWNPVHKLDSQPFLEMMLKSKASRNEDRFYSIFPLFPGYKHFLVSDNNDDEEEEQDPVKRWHITDLPSVKLKLYEVMTTKDKAMLLYLSSTTNRTYFLPTFATSMIQWCQPMTLFKENVPFHITLRQTTRTTIHGNKLYYLHLKPIIKYYCSKMTCVQEKVLDLLKCLGLFVKDDDTFDLVCISVDEDIGGGNACIYLVGSFKKNTWILWGSQSMKHFDYVWDMRYPDDMDGFHIY